MNANGLLRDHLEIKKKKTNPSAIHHLGDPSSTSSSHLVLIILSDLLCEWYENLARKCECKDAALYQGSTSIISPSAIIN